MVESLYQFLSSMGFSHPVHPILTHIVIGNVIAALIFGVVGLYSKNKTIGRASYYVMVLAFVSLFPVIFFGITDWLYFYDGAWLIPIKIKIVLTVILTVILLAAVVNGRNDDGATLRGTFLSFLCVLAVTGLGYYGGDLVYSSGPPDSKNLKIGQQIYFRYCNACHPHDGNPAGPALPILGSTKLSDLNTFIGQLRNPLLANEKRSMMPAFAPSTISDKEAKALYQYIKALETIRHGDLAKKESISEKSTTKSTK
jgi:mono/diheme cytochrome c family protein